ncbi:VWA domain-containing protein [Paraburkholderia panacisoli]|uniref:VWA domain-containing protein n=1 Tax=Paraburkholderia panacisoli TaxID=2603818 RepID=A0A5B0H7Y3_9BURK|nr:pilus assembly protein TadG-related protein [Paraburkholderia panacisoli]KAA1011338.1 VWA domain-containing protein [Paraburkholderia panacisoli]
MPRTAARASAGKVPSQPRSLSTLLKGDEGAITVIFALCATLMIGSMCTAIDTIHYQMTQTRVQMALDVATLSSGVNLLHYNSTTGNNLTQWQADARAYYNANMPSGYMEFAMPDAQFSASISGVPSTGQTIQLSATGSAPLLAPVIFGTGTSSSGSGSGSGSGSSGSSPDTVTITASNTALRMPQSLLELVLVLDNTGSMADYASSDTTQGTKIQGLRTAATDLVNDILGVQNNNSYIGLVPFTTMVNVNGSLLASGSWMTPNFTYNPNNVWMTAQSGVTGSGWGGCTVEPRDAASNLYPKAYAPKDIPGFTPFFYNVPKTGFQVVTYNSTKNGSGNCVASTPINFSGVPLSLQTNGSTTACGIGTGLGIAAAWGQATTSKPKTNTYDQNGNINGKGSPCSIAPVKFLSKDANALTTAIGNMQAAGSTIIPTGLLWGWRMLSSDWSNNVSNGNGWVSTDSTLPRPEATQGLQRVAIVLTDGENDPGSANGIMPPPSFNGLTGVGSSALQAPTVTRTDGTALSNGSTTSVSDINAFQLGVCTAMKNSGIIVYAITFGSDASSSVAQQTMQSCASPGNYYHAPTNATLDAIFQQIAGNLGVLRLTQ